MKHKALALVLFLLSISTSIFSQSNFNSIDFGSVDSLARSIKYENDLVKLTKELITPYSDNISKVRALFIWITENIQYDYKFVNKGKEVKAPDCNTNINCAATLKEWENAYIKKVLEKKKGVCDGYSRLFKKMCDIAGIESEIVSGYIKVSLTR